jgi:hypothetical protein
MIDKIGGRKVVALVIVMLLAVGAVFLKGDVPPNFLQVLQWVFAAFVVGNGVEHLSGAIEAHAGGTEAPDTSGLEAKLTELQTESVKTQGLVAQVGDVLTTILKRINGQV